MSSPQNSPPVFPLEKWPGPGWGGQIGGGVWTVSPPPIRPSKPFVVLPCDGVWCVPCGYYEWFVTPDSRTEGANGVTGVRTRPLVSRRKPSRTSSAPSVRVPWGIHRLSPFLRRSLVLNFPQSQPRPVVLFPAIPHSSTSNGVSAPECVSGVFWSERSFSNKRHCEVMPSLSQTGEFSQFAHTRSLFVYHS